MPYLRVEYSRNLREEIGLEALLDALHTAIVQTGVFPIAGIRIRAYECADYRIGDCRPENAFVHASLEMGHGRSLEVRKAAGEQIFAAITAHLQPLYDRRPFGISFQMHELHPDLNFKMNNMHEESRAPGGAVATGVAGARDS